MSNEPRKLSFEEVLESITIFLVDEKLENEIDKSVAELVEEGKNNRVTKIEKININSLAEYLREKSLGLNVILSSINLSEEKFLRIITLLRREGVIPGGFETEWSIEKIKSIIRKNDEIVQTIARILISGKDEPILIKYLSRFDRERLDFKGIGVEPLEKRKQKLRNSLLGKRSASKGKKIESLIRKKLEAIKAKYGVPYDRGFTRLINTTADWLVPNAADPYVIIMVSYQETTSSGQSTKARDMFRAYQRVCEHNSSEKVDRAFVNFADGAGWLARKRDLYRLVEQCHYFVNLHHMDMLQAIVKKHVPKKYFRKA